MENTQLRNSVLGHSCQLYELHRFLQKQSYEWWVWRQKALEDMFIFTAFTAVLHNDHSAPHLLYRRQRLESNHIIHVKLLFMLNTKVKEVFELQTPFPAGTLQSRG
jgi:hypothetical protein